MDGRLLIPHGFERFYPQYTRRGGGEQDYAQNLQKRMDFVQFVQETTRL